MPTNTRGHQKKPASADPKHVRRQSEQMPDRPERSSADSTGQDERLIGAERFPRKGNDEDLD